ncbi:MAG TPA: serpin family protein [Solirubrobacterales bacterium]
MFERAATWISVLVVVLAVWGSELAGTGQARASKPGLGPAAATGAFGLDLMRAEGPGNLVLSPDSIAAALAMTGSGAAGSTADEIAATLHLRGPAAFAEVGNLQRTIAAEQASAAGGDPEAPTLDIANGLFLQQGLPVEPAFLSGLGPHFGATPEVVDFAGDPAAAVNAINGWVSDHTNGLVPRILESVPPGLRLALANAVYLRANWVHQFEKKNTSPGPFFAGGGRTTAEFMHQTERLRYGSGPGYKVVELPYRFSTLSLMVVLPVGQRLGSLQHRLGPRGPARIARGLRWRPVILSLPRFHIASEIELGPALQRLGMPIAFTEAADFSRITTATRLKIAFVKHATDLSVDEWGTEAAAATVVGLEPTSRRRPPADAVAFNADRPFLFFLRDDRTGAVLFAGRLASPTPP